MTTKDAIEVFNNPTQHWTNEREQAITLAIEALEKQIPKKPNSIFCPVCNFPSIIDGLYGDKYPYCYNCGQAIDWMEDNE